MRTTLDIDDDVLQVAKELARRERKTAGHVISTLARKGLHASDAIAARDSDEARYGWRPFPRRGTVVTNEIIDRLREEEGD